MRIPSIDEPQVFVLGGGLAALAAASLGLEMIGNVSEASPSGELIAYYSHAGRAQQERAAIYYKESGLVKQQSTYSTQALRAFQFWTAGLPEVDTEPLIGANFLNKHTALGRPHADAIWVCEERNGIIRNLIESQQPRGLRYVMDGVRLITNLAANTMIRKRWLERVDLATHTLHFSGREPMKYHSIACSIPLEEMVMKALAGRRKWPQLTDGLQVMNIGGMKRNPWLPERIVRMEIQNHPLIDRIDVFSNVSREKFTPTYDRCNFRVALSAMQRVSSFKEQYHHNAFKRSVTETLWRWDLCDVVEVARGHYHPHFYSRDEEEARLEALDMLSRGGIHQIGAVGMGLGRSALGGHDVVRDAMDGLTVGASLIS